MKFGGAVLKSIDGFRRMLEILNNCEDNKILIVISAFAKSTRNLRNAAVTSEKGNLEDAYAQANDFINEYKEYSNQLITKKDSLRVLYSEYEQSAKRLKDLLKGVSITKELTNRTLDAILSFGEQLSLVTAYYYLKDNGINLAFVDSSNVIVSDSNHGKAKPFLSHTEKNIESVIMPALKSYSCVITQGFVAKSIENEITTMGLESSNLSAAIYAVLLKADDFVVWTDVEGIRTEDPKLNTDTSIIRNLSYKQAYNASVCGLKLLFPGMIELLKKNKIPMKINSAFKPYGLNTVVSDEPNRQIDIVKIIRSGLKYIKIDCCSKQNKTDILNSSTKVPGDLIEQMSANNNYFLLIFEDKCILNYFSEFEYMAGDCEQISLINHSKIYSEMYKYKLKELLENEPELLYSDINSEISKFYFLKD